MTEKSGEACKKKEIKKCKGKKKKLNRKQKCERKAFADKIFYEKLDEFFN